MDNKGFIYYKISIIIPVLYESNRINKIINYLKSLKGNFFLEIIVVDACEKKSTLSVIKDKTVKKICSPRGRAQQMNRGAEESTGDILLFLHADTILPQNAPDIILEIIGKNSFVGGAFALGFDDNRLGIKLISFGAALRYRLTNIPFGDQGIFIRKDYFYKIGCYYDIPFMEDVELMKRVKREGDKILISRERVITSARRWINDGILYTTLRNWMLQILYQLGVSPYKLANYYYKKK